MMIIFHAHSAGIIIGLLTVRRILDRYSKTRIYNVH